MFPTLALLAGIVLFGIVVAALARRWLRRSEDPAEGFSLSDLRDLYSAGDLTEIEFRAARDAMIARLKQRVVTDSKGPSKYTRKKNT